MTKEEYAEYLRADKAALRVTDSLRDRYFHEIWIYQRLLRRIEYLSTGGRRWWRMPCYLWTKWRFKRWSLLLGFSISPHSIGKGLELGHYGDIVINGLARLGEGVTIAGAGVLVGENLKEPGAPVIGDRCYLGPGCKILGPIKIAEGVTIAANAVVVEDVTEPYTTVGGIPARKISDNSVRRP